MAKISDYIHKPIEKKKFSFKFKSVCDILKHAFSSHGLPSPTTKKIETNSIVDCDALYQPVNDIYKDSHERIKSLENKAFGLMTYISAIIAIVVFLLGKDLPTYLKILSCLSMFVLLLALILSFKCLGIKTQKTLFIDALFKWDESIENSNTEGSIPISVNKESIICSLIECTVYNHTVADNTADILRASRILLNFGIILSIVSFYVYIFSYKENKPVIKKIEVVNSNYIDSLTHKRNEELIKSFSEILELKKTIDNK